jgi:hypothetical protein
MRKTKKLTLSALISALSVGLIALGALFGLFDLTVLAFSSLLVAFIYIEIGSPYTFLVWTVTSVLAFVLFPGAAHIGLEYLLVFGIYPILKGYIERLKRLFWWPLKLFYGISATLIIIFTFELVTGSSFFDSDVSFLWMKIGITLLLIAAFVLYDVFLTVLIRYYMRVLRERLKPILK